MPANGILKIKGIKPTPFFVESGEGLLQGVEISVENSGGPVHATVVAYVGSLRSHSEITVEPGEERYRIYVPDVRESTGAEFILKADKKVYDRRKMSWTPKKHWKVYMIPIAHHDFGYTDTIENVLRRYEEFYEDILRFCEETEDWPFESKFRYMIEGAWSIQHFIENRSEEVVRKLVRYLKEGRIEIPALFGNEITALCGGEELIRLMYPSFRLKRRYGVPIRSASITDIPGLSWGLPTVLAGAGVKYFFAGLPTYFEWGRSDIHTFWDEEAVLRPHGRPDAFRWQGPDGESVLVYYQGGYGCWSPSSYEEALNQLPKLLSDMEEMGYPFSVVRFGFGCGDNIPPDIRISYIVREWNDRWAYPKLIVATNSIFFEELERECEDVRTFKGELPHTDYVVGAISTAKETGINRITHDRLQAAEKFATIASSLDGRPYPAEDIRKAYDNLMLYDEHTWGMAYPMGPLQDWNWSDKSRCAYKAAGLTHSILSEGIERIAGLIELKEEGSHIIVFNPLSFGRTDVVRVPRFTVEEPFELIDEETGEDVPYQIVKLDNPQAPVPYSAYRYAMGRVSRPELFELVFVAKDVPPLGYKTYRLVPKDEAISFTTGLSIGENSLENRFFKIILDPQTGAVASIYDKELGREMVDEEAPHRLNQLVARWVESGEMETPGRAEIRKGQTGPVYGSLVVSGRGPGCPQLSQEIILYDGIKRIDFANRLLKDSTPFLEIYFAFPFKIDRPSFRFEGTNSIIRPFVDQFPGSNTNYYTMQHWVDVSNGEIGVTFSSVEAHLVEFGGLWPCYVSQAHHGVTPPDFGREFIRPDELKRGYIYSFCLDSNFRTNFQPVQQGDMLFRYSITTHRGGWREGEARNFGWAIGNPLIPVRVDGGREGVLPLAMSFCQVDRTNVLILTLKRAEDGDGIILRLIETEGKDVTVTLTIPFLTISGAYRTNLVEEDEGKLPFTEHTVTAPVKAFGITTIRIRTVRTYKGLEGG